MAKQKSKKRRTAAQKAATAKLVAFNKKKRGKGGKRKAAKSGSRKKPRTAAQKAATAKLVKRNKARAKGHKPASKKGRKGKGGGGGGGSLIARLEKERAALTRKALQRAVSQDTLAARLEAQDMASTKGAMAAFLNRDPEQALEAANAARAAKVAAELAQEAAKIALKPPVRAGLLRRWYGRPATNQLTLPGTARRKNPKGKKRKAAKGSGRKTWWIADIHAGKRSLCFIGQGTRAEAEASARKLLKKHRAKSVELSGPYASEPSPHSARR